MWHYVVAACSCRSATDAFDAADVAATTAVCSFVGTTVSPLLLGAGSQLTNSACLHADLESGLQEDQIASIAHQLVEVRSFHPPSLPETGCALPRPHVLLLCPGVVPRDTCSSDSTGCPCCSWLFLLRVVVQLLLPIRDSLLLSCLTPITRVLQSLTHLHACRVIHRDLKAGNLLITAEGKIKLSKTP